MVPTRRFAILFAIGCASLSCPSSASDGFDPASFLRTYAGFSNHDLARVAGGTAVARTLPADSDEVAVAAAVFMAVPRSTFITRFKDIVAFKKAPGVLAIGRFSSPPAAADLAALKLNGDSVDTFRGCKPGDCDIRLDKAGIERLRAVASEAGGAEQRIAAAMREHLAAYAADYFSRGDAALMEYHDQHHPRRIGSELAFILGRSPYFGRELAAMRGDVASFGGVARSPHEHMFYWSIEKIASTAVTSLTHTIIATPSSGLSGIASRQIYASHFFHASLGLTLVADTTGPKGQGVTVIYINRSRVDAFSGILGPVKRAAVRSRARGTAERLMNGLRARLERTL